MSAKKKYIATGALIGIISSFMIQFVVLSFSNGTGFFERSISGLKITFTMLPLVMVVGATIGYLFYLIKLRLKRDQEKISI